MREDYIFVYHSDVNFTAGTYTKYILGRLGKLEKWLILNKKVMYINSCINTHKRILLCYQLVNINIHCNYNSIKQLLRL